MALPPAAAGGSALLAGLGEVHGVVQTPSGETLVAVTDTWTADGGSTPVSHLLRVDTAGTLTRFGGTGPDADGVDGPTADASTLSVRGLARDGHGRILAASAHWLVRRFAIQDPPLANGDRSRVKRESNGGWRRDWDSGRYELFDASGRLTTRSRGPGDVDTFTYDTQDRVTTRTDAAGGSWAFSYHPTTGKLMAITDPASRTTLFEVDGSGDLVRAELPDGSEVQFTYDADHRLLTKTDPRGQTWSYSYGLYGTVTAVQFADGSTRQYRPQRAQRLIRDLAPGTGTPEVPAAPFAAPLAELDREGRTFKWSLGAGGRRNTAITPDGQTWTFVRNVSVSLRSSSLARIPTAFSSSTTWAP